MLTDSVYVNLVVSQTNFKADYGGHYRKEVLDSINVCFVDGHVEQIFSRQVKARCGSVNAWVCR
jgi:prepilin-type processing-associated H-X9-DG protein